jgi:hypothetical protein
VLFKQRNQTRRVLAVRDVYHEGDLRLAQLTLDLSPLPRVERRAEVVGRHLQVQSIRALDLALRLLERREQT